MKDIKMMCEERYGNYIYNDNVINVVKKPTYYIQLMDISVSSYNDKPPNKFQIFMLNKIFGIKIVNNKED